MKKSLLLIIAILFCFLTSGCSKHSYNFVIDDSGYVTITEIRGVETEILKYYGKAIGEALSEKINTAKEQLKAEGYIVKDYKDDSFIGFKLIKVIRIKDLTQKDLPEGFFSDDEAPVKCRHDGLKKICSVNLKYDFNIIRNQNTELNHQLENYNNNPPPPQENMEYNPNNGEMNNYSNEPSPEEMINLQGLPPVLELSIKIPQEATKHNAKEVIKGLEYKWDLSQNEINDIKIDYVRYDKNIILTIFAIFAIFLIYITRIPK